ncbi:MAG: hypothetical protein PHT81_05560 [Endomicrobiaceae bacterium]|nr:hypothetical protein [Endomicrobiaceae bacterium]
MTINNKKLEQVDKENSKNTCLLLNGGKAIIQKNSKKGIENTHFNFFIETKTGKEWYERNKIVNKIDIEKPDFLFETSTGKTVGLELTNLIVRSNEYYAAKHISTASLYTIGKQVCHYFKKEKGIALSIVIDIWDPRKWSSHYNEIIDHRYDPGFKDLDASIKEIKDVIIKVLLQNPIPSFGVVKEWIDIGNQKFCISADRMYEPNISVRVNNVGICKEDPFDELQERITDKNTKYKTYKSNCDECDLLVISDDGSTGNFVTFSDKINTHKFISVFKNVYLLYFDSYANVIKLKTK